MFLFSAPVSAEVFMYQDSGGKWNGVSSIDQVPAEYRDQLESVVNESPDPSPEHLKAIKEIEERDKAERKAAKLEIEKEDAEKKAAEEKAVKVAAEKAQRARDEQKNLKDDSSEIIAKYIADYIRYTGGFKPTDFKVLQVDSTANGFNAVVKVVFSYNGTDVSQAYEFTYNNETKLMTTVKR